MKQLIPFPDILPWALSGVCCLLAGFFLMRWRSRLHARSFMWMALRGMAGVALTAISLTYVLLRKDFMVVTLFCLFMCAGPLISILSQTATHSRRMLSWMGISFVAGFLPALAVLYWVMLQGFPLKALQFSIPLGGLLLSNHLTAMSRGISALAKGVKTREKEVETLLMLGASGKMAVKEIIDDTCEAALRGVFESVGGMSAITLPGMFAGMVMAGVLPATAAAYQMAILFTLILSVSGSTAILLYFVNKGMFNHQGQWTPPGRIPPGRTH